jgi:hypothetical protein
MIASPRQWSEAEITADAEIAKLGFRQARFAEPLAAWLHEVSKTSVEFGRLFENHAVAHPHALTAQDVPDIIDAGLLTPLRYLPGPPISLDDLRNLADVPSLSSQRLRGDREASQRVLDVIRQSVDPQRFPWLAENREPTHDERATAIFASALLLAAQKLQTMRRSLAKTEQEHVVREHLKECGFDGVRLRRIINYAQFPSSGVVSENEVQFGPEKADVLSRLWDDRMFPIECKVSNSEVNSYKRLNHDTLAKHHAWINQFGTANVVPSAILAGVFKPSNVFQAQEAGLAIFWSHRVSDVGKFVASTRG